MVPRLTVLIFLFISPFLFSFKNELSKFSYSVRPNEDSSTFGLLWHLIGKMPFSEYRDNHNVHNMPTALFLYLRLAFIRK